jgi:hypothetical protein
MEPENPRWWEAAKTCQDRLWMNSHGIQTQFLEDQNPPVSSCFWWFWDGVFIGFPTFGGAQDYKSSHQRSLNASNSLRRSVCDTPMSPIVRNQPGT